jgi:hypothetical protein
MFMPVELQCMKNSLCQGCCSWRTGRSFPATGNNSFPFLAGVSGGMKSCIEALVRHVGFGHGMTP